MKHDGFTVIGTSPTRSMEDRGKETTPVSLTELEKLKAIERYLTEQLTEVNHKIANFK